MRTTFLIPIFILLGIFFINIPNGYSESQNSEDLVLLEKHLLNFDKMDREDNPRFPSPPFADPLVYPVDIVIGDDERIYITDSYCNSVHIFDSNYKHLFTIDQGVLDFGNLYSLLTDRGTPRYYDSNQLIISGEYRYGHEATHVCNEPYSSENIFRSYEEFGSKTQIPLNVQMRFHEMMALDDDERIYVLGVYDPSFTKKHAAHVFSPDGEYLFSFGHEGSDEELLVKPTGIVVDHQGWIYILDNFYEIKVFSPDGKYMHSLEDENITSHISGSLNDIKVKTGSKGNVYLVNYADAHFSMFSSMFPFRDNSHIDISQITNAWSMTVDDDGKVYVGDIIPHDIKIFSFEDDVKIKIHGNNSVPNNILDSITMKQNITKTIDDSSITKIYRT